jgi:hypothetical protein
VRGTQAGKKGVEDLIAILGAIAWELQGRSQRIVIKIFNVSIYKKAQNHDISSPGNLK